jgi:hypothetical protein
MLCPRFSSRISVAVAATIAVTLGAGGTVRAAEPSLQATPAEAAAPPTSKPAADTLPAEALTERSTRNPTVSYGVAARWRWVSVPKWMLNLFTTENMPLSSQAFGFEFMRRKGEFDMILSVGYQFMGPSDGNWLGKSHDPAIDTDYVQFRNFGMVGIDASFVWHSFLNEWFGLHYGAGLGLGIMTGDILRTSNFGCTPENAGDTTQCYPRYVDSCQSATGCSEAELAKTMNNTGMDQPTTPRRFADPNVPPVIPIVNVLVGIDFRLPRVRGWEAKLEGGFYNAFFLGGGVGYTF